MCYGVWTLAIETLVETLNKVMARVTGRSVSRGRLREEDVSLKAVSCGFLSPAVRLFHPECPPPLAQVLLLASIWLKGALETARLSRPIWSCKTEQRGRGPSQWTERSREGRWRRDRAHHTSLPLVFAILPLHPPFLLLLLCSPLAHVHRRRTHPEQHKERSGQSTSYLLPRNAASPICFWDKGKGRRGKKHYVTKEDGFITPKVWPVYVSRSSKEDLTLLSSPCYKILPLLLVMSNNYRIEFLTFL